MVKRHNKHRGRNYNKWAEDDGLKLPRDIRRGEIRSDRRAVAIQLRQVVSVSNHINQGA